VFLCGVTGEQPIAGKKDTGNFSYSKIDYDMVASMSTWHERVRHTPMDVLHQIHNFNISNAQHEHDKSSEESIDMVEQGGDVVEELINDRQVGKNELMIHGLFKPHDDMSIVMYVFKLNEEETTKHQSLFFSSQI
jgi:hypothetical protein